MEQDFNMKHWAKPCPRYNCHKDICKCGLKFVSIPGVLGDDSENSDVAPKNGTYCNTIVRYEANGNVYIYSKEGIPVLVEEGGLETESNIVHLTIKNVENYVWTATNIDGPEEWEHIPYVRCEISSTNVIFTADNGRTFTINQLYNAISNGGKFAIDVPFYEIGSTAIDQDNVGLLLSSIGTVENMSFNDHIIMAANSDMYSATASTMPEPMPVGIVREVDPVTGTNVYSFIIRTLFTPLL